MLEIPAVSFAAPRGEMHLSWVTSQLAISKLARHSTTAAPVIIIITPPLAPCPIEGTGCVNLTSLFIQLRDYAERTSSHCPQSLETRDPFHAKVFLEIGIRKGFANLGGSAAHFLGADSSLNVSPTARGVLRAGGQLLRDQGNAGAGS